MVDLTKIAQISVVDTAGNWGYISWDSTASIQVDAGAGAGTISHSGKVYAITAADPSAAATAASMAITADNTVITADAE